MQGKKWMRFSIFLMVILLHNIAIASFNTTETGIPLDSYWKQKVYDFAKSNIKHSAWGIAHSERDYQMSTSLAHQEGIRIDTDVIFAAAFLHDIGAIEPFKKEGVEHSIRSVELVEPILKSYGFPMHKWPKVKAAILGHMFYADRPVIEEAIVLHDADALDFLGVIGIARLVSVTERHAWSPNLPGAFITLQKFSHDLPNSLITNTAKTMSAKRISEIEKFLALLDQESFNKTAL